MIGDIIEGLATEAIGKILIWLISLIGSAGVLKVFELKTSFGKRYRIPLSLLRAGLIFGVIFLIYYGLATQWIQYQDYFFAITICVIFLLYLYRVYDVVKARSVGISKVELEIEKGTNYKAALEACKTGICFLGIGGSKLTDEAEFEHALHRCQVNNKPIKLLLAHPASPQMAVIARRAGLLPTAFADKLVASLRKIQDIKNRRGFDIEVRFYELKEFQQFRLMFINENTCLASYTAFGKRNESGSTMPQLILRSAEAEDFNHTYYFPFEQHFLSQWQLATPWDFTSYV